MQEEIKEKCAECSEAQCDCSESAEECVDTEKVADGENDDAADEQEKKLAESNEALLRLKADFDNFRKRTQKEKEDLSGLVKVNIVSKLITVIDNFERGLAVAETQDSLALKTGMEMIYKQLLGFLDDIGVEKIETTGELFDPRFHQAVMRVEDETKEEGTIVAELQKGYRIDDKLVRPSMVQVVGG